jgi:hypothetical protein
MIVLIGGNHEIIGPAAGRRKGACAENNLLPFRSKRRAANPESSRTKTRTSIRSFDAPHPCFETFATKSSTVACDSTPNTGIAMRR